MLNNIAIQPTLRIQCVVFMIGSSLFAIGSSPGLSDALGSDLCNVGFFIGAWFFSTAAFIQLQLSGPVQISQAVLQVRAQAGGGSHGAEIRLAFDSPITMEFF